MNHIARKKKEGNIRFDTQTQPNLNLSLNSSESLRWPLRLYWTTTLVYVCVPAIRAEYCKFNWLRLVAVVVAVAFAPARAIVFEIHTLSHTQRDARIERRQHTWRQLFSVFCSHHHQQQQQFEHWLAVKRWWFHKINYWRRRIIILHWKIVRAFSQSVWKFCHKIS